MKTIIWIDPNELNQQVLKEVFKDDDILEIYLYSNLEEVSEFILNDFNPQFIVIDESLTESIHEHSHFLNHGANKFVFTKVESNISLKEGFEKIMKPLSVHEIKECFS